MNATLKIRIIRIGAGLLCAAGIAGCIGARPPSAAPAPSIPAVQQAVFEEGMKAHADRDDATAARRFQDVIERFPGSPLLEEAQWMLGKSYEAGDDFERARREYRSFLENYPDSAHRYEATLRIDFLDGLVGRGKVRPSLERYIGVLLADDPSKGSGGLIRTPEKDPAPGTPAVVVRGYGANGVFFRTDQAPVIREALASAVAAVHAQGAKIWARIPARHLSWFKVPGEERDLRYDPATRRLTDSMAVDLFHPAALIRIERFFLDLAASGVDGIVIDEDPFIEPWEGFSPSARAAFLEDFGEPLEPERLTTIPDGDGKGPASDISATPLFWKWIGWKNREILTRLGRVIETVREHYPYLVWVRMIPPSAVMEPHRALARSGIDLLEERQHGFDYFILPISDPQKGAGTFERLNRAIEFMDDPKRVIASVSRSEEAWATDHLADFRGAGLFFGGTGGAPGPPLTSPRP